MNNKLLWMTKLAVVAALYYALTMIFHSFSFGMIQIRISEVLMLLVLVDKKYTISLILGCLLSNLSSPYGFYDLIFGVSATAISCLLMIIIKNRWIASIIPVIMNGLIVGFELYYLEGTAFLLNALYVAAGEFIAVTVVGNIAFTIIKRTIKL